MLITPCLVAPCVSLAPFDLGFVIAETSLDKLDATIHHAESSVDGPSCDVATHFGEGGHQNAGSEEPEDGQHAIFRLSVSAGPLGAGTENGFSKILCTL